jgi:glycosyltransferase involved in cell wall biosynthesis
MKIALYYPWIYLHGGPERTIAEVLSRSRHQWVVFTNRYEPASTFPSLQSAGITELRKISVERSFRKVGIAAATIATQKLPLEDCDLLVVCCEGLGDLVLIRNGSVPAVCLCFTPLRAAADPHYQRAYLAMNRGRWWREPLLRLYAALFQAVDRRLWKRYHAVIAISEEVRRRIVACRLFPPEQISVLSPGVDMSRLIPTGVYDTDFVIPGRIMWTKNLQLGIEAFRLVMTRRPDLRRFTLTIAGYVDQKSQPYIRMLRQQAGDCPQIRFVVSPTDEAMRAICANSYAVLYPPFNEDWGLIPLEAMALEKPVVAVNRGGPTETVVDGVTGFLVEPTAASFAAMIERLADDPDLVRRLGKCGRERAAAFDWQHFCSALDNSLELWRSGSGPSARRSS